MNFRGLVRETLRFQQKTAHFIKNLMRDLGRREWKRYHCGNYTDIDECHCPAHGLADEPNSIVRVWGWQIRILAKRGRVWTKYPLRWWF